VVDLTGLSDFYDVTLNMPAINLRGPTPRQRVVRHLADPATPRAANSSGVSNFASIQKLGLKLEPRKIALALHPSTKAELRAAAVPSAGCCHIRPGPNEIYLSGKAVSSATRKA
jgi:hypothetical protein